ncbi:MAG TPA: hypothetical protein VH639_24045 [Bryobacteraceae bacterium]
MKRSLFVSLFALAGLGNFVTPARADVISGSLSGLTTFTPISPIATFDSISGTGEDSLLGAFTLEERSLLTFITFASPADFILSDGTFTEILASGTVHGTASGTGAISTNGTLTSDLHLAFTIGDAPLITEEVMFTGTVVSTGPNTATISGSYLGSLSSVPEPSGVVLFGTVAVAALGYRMMRRTPRRRLFTRAAK